MLLRAAKEDAQEQSCKDQSCRIRNHRVALQRRNHAQALRCHDEVGHGNRTHKGRRDRRDPVVLSFHRQEHGACPQNDHRKRLVRPAEVSPDDRVVDESKRVAEAKECADTQNRDAKRKSVHHGTLVKLQPVGKRQSRGTERRVAGSDRADHNTEHRKDHADIAHRK